MGDAGLKFAYIKKPIPFMLGVFVFAWAIGFMRYMGSWVYFPWFPNILDSLGLMVIGAYLLWESNHHLNTAPKDP